MAEETTTVVSIADAVLIQCQHLQSMTQRIVERGYCVMVNKLNGKMSPRDVNYPFTFMLGAMSEMVDAWNAHYHTHILRVNIFPETPEDMRAGKFTFNTTIPRRVWSREMMSAILICSAYRKGTSRGTQYKGGGIFRVTERSNDFLLYGSDKDAFAALISILEMPQHRAALLGKH